MKENEFISYFKNDILCDSDFIFRKMFWSYWIYYKNVFFGIYNDWNFYIKKGKNSLDIFEENWNISFSYMKLWKIAYLKNYLLLKSEFIEKSEEIGIIFIKSILK